MTDEVLAQGSRRLAFGEPHLLFVMGPPGVGKTTLSKELLRRIHCAYFDNNAFADAFYPDTRRSREYLAIRPKLYDQLFRLISDNLKMANSVLLDAPMIKQMVNDQWRSYIERFIAERNAIPFAIQCVCPPDVLRARLNERGEVRDAWKLANWDRFIEEEPMTYEVPFDGIVVDTQESPTINSDRVVEVLRGFLIP